MNKQIEKPNNLNNLKIFHNKNFLGNYLSNVEEFSRFQKFCKNECSEDNLLCWRDYNDFIKLKKIKFSKLKKIFENYLLINSINEIYLSNQDKNLAQSLYNTYFKDKNNNVINIDKKKDIIINDDFITIFNGIVKNLLEIFYNYYKNGKYKTFVNNFFKY